MTNTLRSRPSFFWYGQETLDDERTNNRLAKSHHICQHKATMFVHNADTPLNSFYLIFQFVDVRWQISSICCPSDLSTMSPNLICSNLIYSSYGVNDCCSLLRSFSTSSVIGADLRICSKNCLFQGSDISHFH